jgi:predicted alpha-1,2-mannosidase
MLRTLISICFSFLLLLNVHAQLSHASFVNPFIGTDGTGHAFPGAVVPFGMVQLSPDTRTDGSWEGCSGYHYSDTLIYGFSHTHLSGTGVSDYGDILITPTQNPDIDLKHKTYAASFSHVKEKASAGYYEVTLKNGIRAQLTATQRVGIHSYSFPENSNQAIVIDLLHRDKIISSSFKLIDSVTAVGIRISTAWAAEQHVYYVMKFNKPVHIKKISATSLPGKKPNEQTEKTDGVILQCDNANKKPLMIKVALSQTGIEGAKKNLAAEAPHWDFGSYKRGAETSWERELSSIDISTKDTNRAIIFYTALYHCFIHPTLAGDVDGKYRGRDNKIHTAKGFTPYTVFSLWDTFRALHPLFTIIQQNRTSDFINSFLSQYKESGRLPVWELSANETNCMIGFHSVSVIADAVTKNVIGFDKNLAYEAMVSASNDHRFGVPVFNRNYHLQMEDEPESVSKTLEYAYDNWCIAQVAKTLNKKVDYSIFMKRAQAYKNLFDKKSGFMRPRKNGNWLSPFDPREVNNHFTEANSWQYSFFVPHDISGLVSLMGGDRKMEDKLDELFSASQQTTGRTQVDISGLIGQYAHGNEPSHHMSFLYNYIGKPHKTQEKVYHILHEFYKNSPDGLIGNEDCGQMSAWFVMSAIGLYQVCPGLPHYTIVSPHFDAVKINLENGKSFMISRKGNISKNSANYITNLWVNTQETNSTTLTHTSLLNGGHMEVMVSPEKNENSRFGKHVSFRSSTSINENNFVTIPRIISPGKLTDSTKTIALDHDEANCNLFYTTDGTEPNETSTRYTQPFVCNSTATLKAKAFQEKNQSGTVVAYIYKKPNDWKIQLTNPYNHQYDAGGDDGIIDGQHGTTNWRSGGWQGYQGTDFECVIDLKEPRNIRSINASFLQDTRSWIIFPKRVEYFISSDGINFIPLGTIENGVAAEDDSPQLRTFFQNNLSQSDAVRFVKVKAVNYGKLPEWHTGKNGDAFIFIDEIEIR